MTVFGDKGFKEVIKFKRGPTVGPTSDRAVAIIRRGRGNRVHMLLDFPVLEL